MNIQLLSPVRHPTSLLLYIAGYSTCLYLILDVLAFSGLLLFLLFGPPYDSINVILGIIAPLAMLPVVIIMCFIQRNSLQVVSTVVGIIGSLGTVILSFLFWFEIINELTFLSSSSLSYGMIGVWQILLAISSLQHFTISHRLRMMTLITGTTIILVTICLLLGQQQHPVFIGLFILAQICSPLWAIWLGQSLLRQGRFLAAV